MEKYKNWLQNYKHISHKVAMDNVSRVKRALSILGEDNITLHSLENLEINDDFKSLSVSVKSQIRRAVKLFIEYANTYQESI